MLEMPNSVPSEDSSEEKVVTEGGAPARVERFTSLRVRDTKTGQFVAGPNPHLIHKGWATALKNIGEASVAGIVGGTIANQIPQNNRSWRQNKKKLEDNLSVTLKKIPPEKRKK